MNNLPNAISAFVQSGGNIGNVLLVVVNFVLAAIIYYTFFIVADRYELKKEQEREAAKQAKRAAQQAQQA